MRRLTAAALGLVLMASAWAGPDAAPEAGTLARAVKALGQSDWKEARLESLAALELNGDSAPALAVLAEAEDRLGHAEQAVAASWKLLRLQSGKEAIAARNRIKRLSPTLSGYLDARDKAVAELAALKRKAEQQGRRADADRIQGRIDAVAGGARPREVRKGWIHFLDAALWRWREKPSVLQVEGDGMTFSVKDGQKFMSQHYLDGPGLTADAGLRFSLKFSGTIPNLFILFSGEKGFSGMNYALIVDPEQERMGFAWYDKERGWLIKESEEMPKGALKPGVSQAYEVSYASTTRRMVVIVDQRRVFDQVLHGEFGLAGSWGIGYGTATTYEVRDVWVKADPE